MLCWQEEEEEEWEVGRVGGHRSASLLSYREDREH